MKGLNVTQVARPTSVEEATELLDQWGPTSRLVAGNTTIYEMARQGALADVDKLIDVMGLGLSYIKEDGVVLRIGSTTTFIEMAKSPLLEDPSVFVVRETARKITPPQVRNMGTIGGAASSGIPFYDMPTSLLAVGARMKVYSKDAGERTIGVDDFFVDYFVTALSPKDLITEFEIPFVRNSGSAFVKIGRTAVDFAMVNASARVTLDDSKSRIAGARVAIGAVAGRPVRATATEQVLSGATITKEKVAEAAKEAASNIDPTPSVHASANYKKKIIPVAVRDALLASIDRARTQKSKK